MRDMKEFKSHENTNTSTKITRPASRVFWKKYLVCNSWEVREVELIVPSGLTLDDYDKTWTLVSCIGFWPVV